MSVKCHAIIVSDNKICCWGADKKTYRYTLCALHHTAIVHRQYRQYRLVKPTDEWAWDLPLRPNDKTTYRTLYNKVNNQRIDNTNKILPYRYYCIATEADKRCTTQVLPKQYGVLCAYHKKKYINDSINICDTNDISDYMLDAKIHPRFNITLRKYIKNMNHISDSNNENSDDNFINDEPSSSEYENSEDDASNSEYENSEDDESEDDDWEDERPKLKKIKTSHNIEYDEDNDNKKNKIICNNIEEIIKRNENLLNKL